MMNGSHRWRGAPAAVALGVVVIAMIGFAPAVPAAVHRSTDRAQQDRSGVAVVWFERLTDLSVFAGEFQATLRDVLVAAGAHVAPLDDTNEVFGFLRNQDVQRVLAAGAGNSVADDRLARKIRRAAKKLGVSGVLLGGAESYTYDAETGTVDARVLVGVLDEGGVILGDDVVSASAQVDVGPGARRAAFGAVSLDLAKKILKGIDEELSALLAW